jgi:hypothetical protein
MIAMKALVGFADAALAIEHNPAGAQAANGLFDAPSNEIARHLESAGLAERLVKAPVTKG